MWIYSFIVILSGIILNIEPFVINIRPVYCYYFISFTVVILGVNEAVNDNPIKSRLIVII